MRVCKTDCFPMHRKEDGFDVSEISRLFLDLLERAMENRPYLLRYMLELDMKSPSTYNHSVLVSMHFYNNECRGVENMVTRNNTGSCFNERLEAYTIAALVHDAGKLSTPEYILHSKDNFRTMSLSEGNRRMSVMHRHSIDGLAIAKEYGFTKEEAMVGLLHHVDSTVLDEASANGFEGAETSRDSWVQEFGKGYVDKLMDKECSWIGVEDVRMVKEISFCDVVESLRSKERAYSGCRAKEWFASEGGMIPSVYSIAMMDVANGKMDEKYLSRIKDNRFRNEFDLIEESGITDKVRSLVKEKASSYGIDIREDYSEELADYD